MVGTRVFAKASTQESIYINIHMPPKNVQHVLCVLNVLNL